MIIVATTSLPAVDRPNTDRPITDRPNTDRPDTDRWNAPRLCQNLKLWIRLSFFVVPPGQSKLFDFGEEMEI